jgi:hypothetical protein
VAGAAGFSAARSIATGADVGARGGGVLAHADNSKAPSKPVIVDRMRFPQPA